MRVPPTFRTGTPALAFAAITKPGFNPKRALYRRGFAIHAYNGANGSGKTMAAVHDTIVGLEAGRPCLSTVRLLDYSDPHECGERSYDTCDDPSNHETSLGIHRAAHLLYTPFTDFRQLLAWESGDVLMDEVTGVANSRASQLLPIQVVNFLMQLRRRDVTLRWTAPNYARADKTLREVTQAVTNCVGYMAVTASRGDGTERLWRDRRLFSWSTYDAFAFDSFTSYKAETLTPLFTQWFWRPGSKVAEAYATLDPVLSLGAVTDSGMCMTCGGKRSQARCRCASSAHTPHELAVELDDF
jgi:hypothetical protein